MKNIDKKIFFWDFDGVLMDSMPVRNKGFELVLKDFPKDQVDELMNFHLKNGGLSRYVKFRYFFENIRNEPISDYEINKWAKKFSVVMRKELVAPKLLIEDSLAFVKNNFENYDMHIVSGSDQEELRFLCNKMNIEIFFKSINGSPTPKIELVKNLLIINKYQNQDCVLIGDSLNDYDAAFKNEIDFIGYNNVALKQLNAQYLESFR